MRLAAWLTTSGTPDAAFADRIEITRQALWRYKAGRRIPHRKVLKRILEATDGAVTANDFIHSAPTPQGAAA